MATSTIERLAAHQGWPLIKRGSTIDAYIDAKRSRWPVLKYIHLYVTKGQRFTHDATVHIIQCNLLNTLQ